jgi:hypothetical protein
VNTLDAKEDTMPDRRVLEHKAFAAEVRHRLNEWEVEDWLQLRDEQRARRPPAPPERVARPAPRRAASTAPMLYSSGGRVLFVR